MEKNNAIICEDCGGILIPLGSMDKESKVFGSIDEAPKEITCKNCGAKYTRHDKPGNNGGPGTCSYRKK